MDPFLGEITMFGGNFAPRGWAFCNGQLLPISQNQALFSLLGTIYGGDGRTTFALPDLRGRNAIHAGHGAGLTNIPQGSRSGRQYITLNQTNLPAHDHTATNMKGTILVNEEDGIEDDAQGRNFGVLSANSMYNTNTNDKTMAAGAVSVKGSIFNQGAQQSFMSLSPFLGISYIIALQGTFPSRS